jgi:hypothetical protein
MNKALLILGGGAVLYYFYSKQTAAPAATPAPAAAGATPPLTPTQPLTATPVQPASGSTAQRAQIVNYINGSGVSSTFIYGQQTPDTWNWYAMQAFPGWTAPTPETLYPGVPNVHSMTYTFDDWFGRVQQYLPPATSGVAGMGRVKMISPYMGPGGWYA